MKKYCFLVAAFLIFQNSNGQLNQGKVVSFFINAKTLQNKGGENPNRKVSVYLPPGYEKVISDSRQFITCMALWVMTASSSQMKMIFDKGIVQQKIRPFILVIASHHTEYEGSFYSNSSLTGNWSDFAAKELIEYVDKNFKTLASRDSRGIAGHSMGGYGAIKMGMLFPEVFGSVYALSPGLLAFVKEFGPNSDSFKELSKIKSMEELRKRTIRKYRCSGKGMVTKSCKASFLLRSAIYLRRR